MWAVAAAFIVGLAWATSNGMAGQEAAAVGAGAALGVYLALCWWRPWKPCPSCRGDDRDRDGAGNYRRFECWRCHGAKDYPRIGARLLGRGRDR